MQKELRVWVYSQWTPRSIESAECENPDIREFNHELLVMTMREYKEHCEVDKRTLTRVSRWAKLFCSLHTCMSVTNQMLRETFILHLIEESKRTEIPRGYFEFIGSTIAVQNDVPGIRAKRLEQ